VGILTFEQALDNSANQPRRHLLLGNGFSIACRPDIFVYRRLLEKANFDLVPKRLRKAFDILETVDFEEVIRALKYLAKLIELYLDDSSELKKIIEEESEILKDILVKTIASSHPDRPNDISRDEYQHCKQFLQHFERIFTLNYDLLLYWTLMQEDIIPNLRCDDGFRKPEDKDAEYVTWEPENTYSQNIYYLHGALHIFDAGSEIQKYTWIDTGIPLMEQIRDALEKNYFPLFVAEGTSEEKLTRIKHSDYLSKAYRSFIPIRGALFIYGHSLSDNDNHILRLIEIGKISQLYVSIYGNPEDENNIKLIQKANALTTARHPRNPLEVFFYDAESAQVWR